MADKRYLAPLFLVIFLSGALAQIQTTQTAPEQGIPNALLTQIIANQSTLNQKIESFATKDDVSKAMQAYTTNNMGVTLQYFAVLMIIMEIIHWVIFFKFIGEQKIPRLGTQKAVKP